MGEIMELTHNLPIHQCVLEAHTHFHAHFAFKDVHTLPHAYKTDAGIYKTDIRIEWIMKLLLTLSTYDPLSITQMDTTLSYWSRPFLFHFLIPLVVFHLVTSPLICIAPLMVSVTVDGTINQGQHLPIITTETNWAHAPRPWKPQMSWLGAIHTASDIHSQCPVCKSLPAQVYL